ncbi:gamma-glutamyl-gamma-aminobutyrate hydrolase family protein [Frigoribacterium salinisoli]
MTSSPAPRLAVVEVTRSRPHAPGYHAYVDGMNARLLEAVLRRGWDAERLAAGDLGRAALLRRADTADAVVVMGGEDLSPALWGGPADHPHEGRHHDVADEAQLALVERALRRGTPLLGICRGHQLLAVATGGTLVPHLDDAGGEVRHRTAGAPPERLMHRHPVDLVAGSRLRAALGARPGVQSAHHQAVDLVGPDLEVVGRAADGVVEAVEHRWAPAVGVQWHPEDRRAPSGQLGAVLDLVAPRSATLARRSRLAA